MFNNKLKNLINLIEKKSAESLETIRVDENIREIRLNKCNSCEYLYKPTKNCQKCGCFVVAKTWLRDTSCPIKKW
jgi:hypothetical protein